MPDAGEIPWPHTIKSPGRGAPNSENHSIQGWRIHPFGFITRVRVERHLTSEERIECEYGGCVSE
jgi:hypothetical protein